MADRNGFKGFRFTAVVAAVLIGFAPFAGATAASADSPSPAATQFFAPRCAGDTTFDPTNTSGVVPDVTSVFGKRLTDYNAGRVAVLYDSYGGAPSDSYPPLCGTRYVEGVGPVSEWMFCTDIHSHVCGWTAADGGLLNEDGDPIDGLQPKTENPRLDPDQEKLVAYLIQKGHSYDGVGSYDWGTTTATADATGVDGTKQRLALQTLIWCISDPLDSSATGTEAERYTTCQNSMDAAEQAKLLARIPDVPQATLSFGATMQVETVGDEVKVTLATNLYDQPIAVSTAGVSGTLAVCGGASASLAGGVLTLPPGDPNVTSDIPLCFTTDAVGSVTVSASATPASVTHIGWNQSPGVALDTKPCQVYATFNEVNQLTVASSTSASFVVPSSGQRAAELPNTGHDPAVQLWIGLLTLMAGVAAVAWARRRAHS